MKKTGSNNFVLDINSNLKKQCAEVNCKAHASYKAPYSRDRLNEYIYFCLDHVREYNKKWNYYEGLDNDEIESEIRKATTWERPSWPTRNNIHQNWDKINFDFENFENINNDNLNTKPLESFSSKEIKAFKIIKVSPTKSIETIKKAYKKLVKKYHPDYNIGNKEYENKIKEINQAYNDLKEIK